MGDGGRGYNDNQREGNLDQNKFCTKDFLFTFQEQQQQQKIGFFALLKYLAEYIRIYHEKC